MIWLMLLNQTIDLPGSRSRSRQPGYPGGFGPGPGKTKFSVTGTGINRDWIFFAFLIGNQAIYA